jgi:putative ABC transport system permease protein
MIPIKYNTRNLRVRWVTTMLTVVGTGMIVWSSCLLFSLVEGLQYSMTVSGDPLDLIVLRKGSTNEVNGGFAKDKADSVLTLEGIARDSTGLPLAAPELLYIPVVERNDGSRTNIIIRGVSPASRALRPKFEMIPGQGHYFTQGRGECVVSRNVSNRFKGAKIGGLIHVGDKQVYRVVGLFTANGSAAESEVWVDIKDLSRDIAREASVSCVQLRASSAADLDRIKKTIDNETRFKLEAVREKDFYAKQSATGNFLKVAGTLIAVLLTIGAMFAAANTMYAAVGARTREIGTLRALGFSQFDILVSFLGESILLCVLGGALGLLATLPLSAFSFGMSNFNTFSESTVNFRFGPLVMGVAVAMTFAMGVFGGLFPAIRAVRMDVIKALREL